MADSKDSSRPPIDPAFKADLPWNNRHASVARGAAVPWQEVGLGQEAEPLGSGIGAFRTGG